MSTKDKNSPLPASTLPVTLIGAGAVAHALGRHLVLHGYSICGVMSRSYADAQTLAHVLKAGLASDDLRALPPQTRLICLCISDTSIADVALQLSSLSHAWPTTVVLHTSGALTTSVLQPLTAQSALVLSFHPLQSFNRATVTHADRKSAMAGIHVGIEGTPEAIQWGEAFAQSLDLNPVLIPTSAKATYHLAASVASNFFVTLMALSQEILATMGIDPEIGFSMLQPLIEETWNNLKQSNPERALTGPIVRGDHTVLLQHGKALHQNIPDLIPVYTALAAETVRLAVQSGRLDPTEAEVLLDTLHHWVAGPQT